MKKRTGYEQFLFEAIKTARTAIRLKYSLRADRELNERLPELAETIELAFKRGESFELSAAEEFFDDEI